MEMVAILLPNQGKCRHGKTHLTYSIRRFNSGQAVLTHDLKGHDHRQCPLDPA